MTSAPRNATIRAALCAVHDPCSVAMNVPMNVLDMGLVRGWTVTDGHVAIEMVLTSAMCVQASSIVEAIESAVSAVADVTSVTVTIDYGTLWDPSDMSERGEASIRRRRRHTLALTGAHPQQWREHVEPNKPDASEWRAKVSVREL
jgi:metal-sulfur cluster biosynthetic enzyme